MNPSKKLSMNDRINRLDRAIAEDRLIRSCWTQEDEKGRELVCLLAALSPEAGKTEDAANCPAFVMPKWLALATPLIDDEGSEELWQSVISRYASLARRWHVLSKTQWKRLEYRVRAAVLNSVMSLKLHKNDVELLRSIISHLHQSDLPGARRVALAAKHKHSHWYYEWDRCVSDIVQVALMNRSSAVSEMLDAIAIDSQCDIDKAIDAILDTIELEINAAV